MNYLLLLNTTSQKDEKLNTEGLDDTAVPHRKIKITKIPLEKKLNTVNPNFPLEKVLFNSQRSLPFSLSCSVNFFSPHIWRASPALIPPYLTPLITLRKFFWEFLVQLWHFQLYRMQSCKTNTRNILPWQTSETKIHKEMRRITFNYRNRLWNNSCQDNEHS